MIKLEKINKMYNSGKSTEFHALKDISLAVNEGEMIAIIGRSGSGKSTLLHILGAVDEYDSGSYIVSDENTSIEIGKLNQREKALFRNNKVGIVLQDFALVEGYNVIDNVMIPLRFSNRKKSTYKNLAMNSLQMVGMEGLYAKEVNKLSGGQKQRVAIARAIVNEPDFILADEPTGALDMITTNQIIDLFCALNKLGKTIIIVTHDSQVAERCNRRIHIEDGKIIDAFV